MTTPQQKRRRRNIALYLKRRPIFLAENPWCLRCGGNADQIHHKEGRGGLLLLDESRWASACGDCHRYITEHPAEAIERGWSLPRIGRGDDAA